MSDEITKFEVHRAKLAASLSSVADSMRSTAALAESFADMVSSLAGGDKKGRKRKGAAAGIDDADEKSAKRTRKVKDPNAPKRPASSYIMFQNDIRKELKEKNPHLSNPDLLALISQKWAAMSEEEKAVYTQASASAKEQYSNEKKAYDARSPEEVAAANAAAEAARAAKKSKPRARAPKAPAASATPATTAGASASASSSNSGDEDEDGSESSDGEDDESPKKAPAVQISESEEESEEEGESSEEEEKPKMKVKTPTKVKEKEKDVKMAKAKLSAAPEKKKKMAK